MTEPTIQATPAVASTIQMLSLPSPASAPAAMSDASPGPGMPAPMIATSTNMIAYSDKSTADHLTMATGTRPRSAGRYRHRRSWRLDLGGARGRPPQEDLPDLRDDDDRQRHGQADEPLPDVEAGGLQERLQRPEHGGEQERQDGYAGGDVEGLVGERVQGEHRPPFVLGDDREEQGVQRERDQAHGVRDLQRALLFGPAEHAERAGA